MVRPVVPRTNSQKAGKMVDRGLTVLSYMVNVLTFGSPREMFCARAHRKGWRIAKWIDVVLGKPNHCAAMYVWQMRHRRPK